ncbi:MAG: type II toxin-antitoxin system RelE/ParE family toxin [Melioribacteraceae bacterium]|jgi:proteic killer suppression protein|nr:MAG: type II toxin-antitoxin system RelE/ParE family toxin [Melioribacteraceae bacterium]
MIKSFSNKETEKIFNREISQKLSGDIQRTALRKLLLIDAAVNLNDLRVPPGNRLEKLTGNLKGKYSIRINNQYRIIFEFEDGNAYKVEIIDYH